jgi:hypothetical protein
MRASPFSSVSLRSEATGAGAFGPLPPERSGAGAVAAISTAVHGDLLLAGARASAMLQAVAIMIDDTVSKIEAKIRTADSIQDEKKRELLQLLGTLKSEIEGLSGTHGEQAQSIARFTELSTHEATRAEQNPELLNLSLKGLTASVEGFEQSHPRLVQIVNAISNTLSNLGI